MKLRTAATLIVNLVGSHRRSRVVTTLFAAWVAFVCGSTYFVSASLEHAARLAANEAPALIAEELRAGRPTLMSAETLSSLAALPSVRSVRPRLFGYLYLAALDANVLVLDRGSLTANTGTDFAGRLPETSREVLLGHGIANALGLRLHDAFAISGRGPAQLLTVVGIGTRESSLVTNDWLVATHDVVASVLGTESPADAIVEVYPPSEQPLVETKIAALGLRTVTRTGQRNFAASTYGRISAFLAYVETPVWLSLAIFVWLTARADRAAARENAALRARGVDIATILFVRGTSDALPVMVGSSVGVCMALLHVHAFGAPIFRATLMSGTLPLDFPVGLDSIELALVVLFAPALTFLMSAWSHVASTLRPPFFGLRTGLSS